ncbi:MAG: hypothetical protein LH613_09320 [Chamaesiphon sp.]|nr:hypothetical protein [Chamaesiphon sp.]
MSISSENRHQFVVRLDLNGNILVASRWWEREAVDSLQNYATRCKICIIKKLGQNLPLLGGLSRRRR